MLGTIQILTRLPILYIFWVSLGNSMHGTVYVINFASHRHLTPMDFHSINISQHQKCQAQGVNLVRLTVGSLRVDYVMRILENNLLMELLRG